VLQNSAWMCECRENHVMKLPCPPDDTADEYVMGRLSPQEAAEFESHCKGCPQCEEQVSLARGLVRGLRAITTEGKFKRKKRNARTPRRCRPLQ
jgi:anti-sigma factor RsiW